MSPFVALLLLFSTDFETSPSYGQYSPSTCLPPGLIFGCIDCARMGSRECRVDILRGRCHIERLILCTVMMSAEAWQTISVERLLERHFASECQCSCVRLCLRSCLLSYLSEVFFCCCCCFRTFETSDFWGCSGSIRYLLFVHVRWDGSANTSPKPKSKAIMFDKRVLSSYRLFSLSTDISCSDHSRTVPCGSYSVAVEALRWLPINSSDSPHITFAFSICKLIVFPLISVRPRGSWKKRTAEHLKVKSSFTMKRTGKEKQTQFHSVSTPS